MTPRWHSDYPITLWKLPILEVLFEVMANTRWLSREWLGHTFENCCFDFNLDESERAYSADEWRREGGGWFHANTVVVSVWLLLKNLLLVLWLRWLVSEQHASQYCAALQRLWHHTRGCSTEQRDLHKRPQRTVA